MQRLSRIEPHEHDLYVQMVVLNDQELGAGNDGSDGGWRAVRTKKPCTDWLDLRAPVHLSSSKKWRGPREQFVQITLLEDYNGLVAPGEQQMKIRLRTS